MEERALVITWEIERDGVVEPLGHNEITTAGLNNLLDVAFGLGGTVVNSTNAYIGVGDSGNAFDSAQTDLQASTNKLRKCMVGGYPARASQTVTLRAQFTGTEANFTWREYAIFWGATGSKMLSRRVQGLGTKSSGTWTLTASVTLA